MDLTQLRDRTVIARAAISFERRETTKSAGSISGGYATWYRSQNRRRFAVSSGADNIESKSVMRSHESFTAVFFSCSSRSSVQRTFNRDPCLCGPRRAQ